MSNHGAKWCCFWDTLREGSYASGIHCLLSCTVHIMQCLALHYMNNYYGSDRSTHLAYQFRKNKLMQLQRELLSEQYYASMADSDDGGDGGGDEARDDDGGGGDGDSAYLVVPLVVNSLLRSYKHHDRSSHDPQSGEIRAENQPAASPSANDTLMKLLHGKIWSLDLKFKTPAALHNSVLTMLTTQGVPLAPPTGALASSIGSSLLSFGGIVGHHDKGLPTTTSIMADDHSENDTMHAPLFSSSERDRLRYSTLVMFGADGALIVASFILFIGIGLRNQRVLLFWISVMGFYILIDFSYHCLLFHSLVKFQDIQALVPNTWFQMLWAFVLTFWTFRSGLHLYSFYCVHAFRVEIAGLRTGISKAKTISEYGNSVGGTDKRNNPLILTTADVDDYSDEEMSLLTRNSHTLHRDSTCTTVYNDLNSIASASVILERQQRRDALQSETF